MTHAPSSYGSGLVGKPALTQVTRAVKVEVDHDIRCQSEVEDRRNPGETKLCGCLLAELAARPWRIQCRRCKLMSQSSDPGRAPGI